MTEQTDRVALESTATAAAIAHAAGAEDAFVFRRLANRRFAHVGGAGRGVGWAGIVEVGVSDEPLIATMLESGAMVCCDDAEPTWVFGPYYARSATAVPLDDDVFVVFGSQGRRAASVPDDELVELARAVSASIDDVGPAKRLADELEVLHAIQDLLHSPAETFAGALRRLADHARAALSCDLGVVHIVGHDPVISDCCDDRQLDAALVGAAMDEIATRTAIPRCIQRASVEELPAPFRSTDGVLAYYVLELTQPLPGLLLLLHTTTGTPRGFTLLCQSLGQKLVAAAEPLLSAALLRDTMRAELERAEAEARRDPLTRLANRLAWDEALASATASPRSAASIVQLDCRGLKEVNNSYGHHVGDELLRRVAAILATNVRLDDLVVRFGGDEFAILLRGADEEVTRALVWRIETALGLEGRWGDVDVELAIGTATCRDGDLVAAHQRADREMLAAKRRVPGIAHPAAVTGREMRPPPHPSTAE
jgi:diguanylate cyclase (GGDEF)-like protein